MAKESKTKKMMAKNDKQTLSDKPEQRWPETNKNKDGQRQTRTKMAKDKQQVTKMTNDKQ